MAFTILPGYTAKAPLDNAASQMTKLVEFIAEDGGAMIPIKNKEGLDFLKEVQADIKAGKCTKPLLKLGTDGDNLVARVEGQPKYAESVVIVKGYVKLKKERAKTTVVNAQEGDSVIDDATKDMGKVKGVKTTTSAKVDLNAKGSTAPIIILAHGTPTGTLPGTVYATKFADKSPGDIVAFLVKTKKLDKKYAGVIYLDGCYTAAGPKKGKDEGELTNYCKKVYDGLVKEGYKYLQVKGNLGRAATLDDGKENVLDAQQEAEINIKKKKLTDDWNALREEKKQVKATIEKLVKVSEALVKRHNGNAETLKADVGLKLVKDEVDKLETKRAAAKKKLDEIATEYEKLKKDAAPEGDFRINDLVGVFGPEKLSKEPWYKRLFG